MRLLAQSSPAGLLLATERDWQLPRHVDLIDGLLVRVAAGELRRLIVTVPVRHGKSEMCSRFFPAWLLGMRPDFRIVVAGYGSDFAEEWGEKARDLLTNHGPRFYGRSVSKSSSAKARWKVDVGGGGMFALGVGSPLTGRGANVLVIDDPIKNSEEAFSETLRNKVWNWYWSTARTRLEPGGAIVILMARWHEDDLVGRLLSHPPDGEEWTVVNLPALADSDEDPLGREVGEALWPERFSREELEATRKSMLSLWWNALYQQQPAPPEGFMFKRKDFRYWRIEVEDLAYGQVIPRRWYVLADGETARRFDTGHCTTFQTVDVAMSEKETADWTVVATWQSTPDKDLLLMDVERRRFEEQQIADFLMACNDKHGRPPMWVERFGAGRNPLSVVARHGYPVMEIPPEAGTQTDKVTRAFGAVALCERHKLFLPHGQPEWLGAYEDELASFNNATHDDQVDCTSYAARLLPSITGGGSKSRVRAASGDTRNERY